MARGGKIVDASFVDVPRQHNTRGENEQIKAGGEPEGWEAKKRSHKDTDARWTQKGGERHFGYKNHAKVARTTKLIADLPPKSRTRVGRANLGVGFGLVSVA